MGEKPSQTFPEVEAWLRNGRALRQRLEAERQTVIARLQELDTALASLPGGTREVLGVSGVLPVPGADHSTPEKVLRVLQDFERPASATEVIEALHRSEPGLDTALIHSALYRLTRRGAIRAEGEKGRKVYLIAAPEEQDPKHLSS